MSPGPPPQAGRAFRPSPPAPQGLHAGRTPTMLELFVYYRADPAQALALTAAVGAAQDRLRAGWPGLQARLLRQPERPPDGRDTWMECYRRPGAKGLDAALEAAIESTLAEAFRQLPGPAPGPRHAERFVPALPAAPPPCA